MIKRLHIHIDGVVQGVGFRPFIYRLANRFNLVGFVYNHSEGVEIEIQGDFAFIDGFITSIQNEKPPLSKIDNISINEINLIEDENTFKITESIKKDNANTLLPPDIATCNDCITELFDPNDRRYKYPFINCMNCGPRYTIIHSIPYDRHNTTMSVFKLCPECQNEYENPMFRRFHAEPNACDICGPHLTLFDEKGNKVNCDDEIEKTIRLLKDGNIVAVKSLGGFHLVCDAKNTNAIQKLRDRKKRSEKPFAVMSYDIEKVKLYCEMSEEEETLLKSPQRPIVLLRKKNNLLSSLIAPNNNYIGVMIAYNPIQLLLLKDNFIALVMTSGNISEEPIAITNEEALSKLDDIADAFLVHNRDINTRIDDSITFIEHKQTFFIRRARGYVPNPITYIDTLKPILAVGGELKNTIALSRNNQVFISQHLGDLKNIESYNFFTDTIHYLSTLLDLPYQTIAHDKHPDYLSTQYAISRQEQNLKTISIQHHKAHISSCFLDNQIKPDQNIIGISFDGTGLGDDDTIWGGEIFIGNLYNLKRACRIETVKMIGGEKAIIEPYRMAVSYLMNYIGEMPDWINIFEKNKHNIPILLSMSDKNINSPFTSSAGRLFDAVASLITGRDKINFEAQASIELQMLSETKIKMIDAITPYTIKIEKTNDIYEFNLRDMFIELIDDMKKRVEKEIIGLKFHKSLCVAILEICEKLSYEIKSKIIILSGGVFQNRLLLHYLISLLSDKGFTVITHKNIPCNDGGISAGQILLANFSEC